MAELHWSRSSIPAPMSRLEYDLLGVGYAAGFGNALSGYTAHPIEVRTRRHRGHLYSAVVSGIDRDLPASPAAAPGWKADVLPRLAEHAAEFRQLATEEAGPALTRAREMFAECIAIHHNMLLPARRATADLLALTGTFTGDHMQCALHAVTPAWSPTLQAAFNLADASPPDLVGDAAIIARVACGATDGDGYGLAAPGWLEESAYARRVHRLLHRHGVTAACLRLVRTNAEDRRRRVADALARSCPSDLRGELASLLRNARMGAVLAEEHGPAMHIRYTCDLRALVLAHGKDLASAGLLSAPEDVMHATLAEITARTITPRLALRRRAAYTRSLSLPLPPASISCRVPARCELPGHAATRLTVLGSVAGHNTGQRSWQGHGAAAGHVRGHARVLRVQADLDMVQPGDVAVVPDAGPGWGWLAVAGVPLVIEHGSPLGHAPAIARLCGTACVIGGPGLSDAISEGQIIKVSGDTGEVTW
jgi:PEP-utilising enzyme, mobile domain